MAQVNRRKISLHDEAKAGLSSLGKQTSVIFLGLLVMLIITSGNPPAFIMGLCVLIGTGFVSWSEKRRLTELEEADLEPQPAVSHNFAKGTQPNTDLTTTESQLLQLRISPNKLAVVQKYRQECFSDTPKSLNAREFLYPIQQIAEAQTDNFIELAKIAGLDPLKDFVRADLRNVDLSNANLTGINLSDAYLGNANLSDANLSHANLNYADMSGAIVYGANLSFAKLDGVRVEGSRFGWNTGLTEDVKRDLQQRGAIFEDSAGDRSPVKTPI